MHLIPVASYHINQFLYGCFENSRSFYFAAIERGVYGDSSLLVSLVCSISHEKIIAEKNGDKNKYLLILEKN